MPSPISHIALGFGLNRILNRAGKDQPIRLRLTCLILFFSVAPDLDALPGWIFNNMLYYHNGISHSLAMAILVAALAAPLIRYCIRSLSWLHSFLIPLTCYSSHIFLDLFAAGRGVMVFWPIWDQRLQFPYPPFRGLKWSEGWLSTQHLLTALNELVWIGLIAVSFWGWSQWRKRIHS